jgi:hypothetical protein
MTEYERGRIEAIERVLCLIGLEKIGVKEKEINNSLTAINIEEAKGKIKGMEIIEKELKTWIPEQETTKEATTKDVLKDVDGFVEFYKNFIGEEDKDKIEPILKFIRNYEKENIRE